MTKLTDSQLSELNHYVTTPTCCSCDWDMMNPCAHQKLLRRNLADLKRIRIERNGYPYHVWVRLEEAGEALTSAPIIERQQAQARAAKSARPIPGTTADKMAEYCTTTDSCTCPDRKNEQRHGGTYVCPERGDNVCKHIHLARTLAASKAELARIAQAAIHPENWTPVASIKPARPFLAGLRAAFGAPMSLLPACVGVRYVG